MRNERWPIGLFLLLGALAIAPTDRSGRAEPAPRVEVPEGVDELIDAADRSYSPKVLKSLTTDVSPVPLDRAVAKLCARYRAATPWEQASIRREARWRKDLSGTLVLFSRRAAVLGERERSARRIRDALTALAIESASQDFRDDLISIALIHHCTGRAGASREDLFRDAAAMSSRRMARLLLGFLDRRPKDRTLEAFGFTEVMTEQGVGYRSR